MKELEILQVEILQEVITELEYLEEMTYDDYQSETISGGGGHYKGTYMGYFDKDDRDNMVKKLKTVYETLKERITI